LHVADDRQFVGDLCLAWKQLAYVHPGHFGDDRFELAADLCRGIRLHVVHVNVAGSAPEQDHDDRLDSWCVPLGAHPQQIAEHESAEAETAVTQKAPARQPTISNRLVRLTRHRCAPGRSGRVDSQAGSSDASQQEGDLTTIDRATKGKLALESYGLRG